MQSPPPSPISVFFCAGEASGDEHAAAVALALREIVPTCSMAAMGGAALQAAGAELVVDSRSVGGLMGFGDVIKGLGRTFAALRTVKQFLRARRPSVIVLVDYPDFNFRIGAFAASLGIPIVYFIPPKVWAWRTSRIETMRRFCTKICCIFPHEERFFQERGAAQAKFVGHPYGSNAAMKPIDEETRHQWLSARGLDPTKPVVTVFLGSRRGEIQRHRDLGASLVAEIKTQAPDAQIIFGIASSISRELLPRELLELAKQDTIHLEQQEPLQALRVATAAVLKSGTSNLQAAFFKVPFVMFYRASRFAAWVVKNFVRISQYSPVNVVVPNTVQEFLQERANAHDLATAVVKLLEPAAHQQAQQALAKCVTALRGSATSPDTYQAVAEKICDLAHFTGQSGVG